MARAAGCECRMSLHVQDGAAYLRRAAERGEAYDVVVIDAADSGAQTNGALEAPPGLLKIEMQVRTSDRKRISARRG